MLTQNDLLGFQGCMPTSSASHMQAAGSYCAPRKQHMRLPRGGTKRIHCISAAISAYVRITSWGGSPDFSFWPTDRSETDKCRGKNRGPILAKPAYIVLTTQAYAVALLCFMRACQNAITSLDDTALKHALAAADPRLAATARPWHCQQPRAAARSQSTRRQQRALRAFEEPKTLPLPRKRAPDVGGQAQRAHLAQRAVEGELRAAERAGMVLAGERRGRHRVVDGVAQHGRQADRGGEPGMSCSGFEGYGFSSLAGSMPSSNSLYASVGCPWKGYIC